MKSRFRQLLEQVEMEKCLAGCQTRTGLDEELLRDQLFEVLTVMLGKQKEYEDAFENPKALAAYLQRATIRNAIRQAKRSQKHLSEELSELKDGKRSPEQQVQEYLDQKSLMARMEDLFARSSEKDRVLSEFRQLLGLVLTDPERYIRKRESGPKMGNLVFQHAALATSLGWTQKHLSNRLSKLRQLLSGAFQNM